jgi:hypothetical protein
MAEGMEAGFCSCDHDGVPASVFRRKVIVARKQHKCCECGATIQPGEKYEKVDGLWEDMWEHHTTCAICDRIRQDYCAPYTMLRETIWYGLEVDILGEWGEEDDDV